MLAGGGGLADEVPENNPETVLEMLEPIDPKKPPMPPALDL